MKLLLVDGHYYLYRSFHAIRGLTNARGEPTNAIYGFAKALRKMLSDLRPDLAAVIWDCGVPARRLSLQPEYKATRPPMPDDMRPQETWLQENVPLFGVASLFLTETEADDLIAFYARKACSMEMEVVIATNDKDIMQLVGDSIRIYSTNKSDAGTAGFGLLGTEQVRQRWGVDPAQIGEVLSLTGDASDNIPGVRGVGEKTAAQLIREHGNVKALFDNLDQVKNEKLREKLTAAKEAVFANREMVRLDEDLSLPAPVETLTIAPKFSDLIKALQDCGFRGLLKEIEEESRVVPQEKQIPLF